MKSAGRRSHALLIPIIRTVQSILADSAVRDRQCELVAHFRFDPCACLARAVVQYMSCRVSVDVVEEAYADFIVGQLALELIEVQLRGVMLGKRTQFVEVVFEPVREEQRIAARGQPEGRTA